MEYIAKNDPEWIVRVEAVSKIKDKDVLIDIAYNDIDDPVKRDVIRKIDDEDVLIDLLYRDESSDILSLILSRINATFFLLMAPGLIITNVYSMIYNFLPIIIH